MGPWIAVAAAVVVAGPPVELLAAEVLPVAPALLVLEEPAAPLVPLEAEPHPRAKGEQAPTEPAAPPEEVAPEEPPAALLLEPAEVPFADGGLLVGPPFELPCAPAVDVVREAEPAALCLLWRLNARKSPLPNQWRPSAKAP